jgi:hypothetical protein
MLRTQLTRQQAAAVLRHRQSRNIQCSINHSLTRLLLLLLLLPPWQALQGAAGDTAQCTSVT